MSTTFGVYKKGDKVIQFDNDSLPDEYDGDDFIEVAFRHNGGRISWLNDLAPYLPDNLMVYPLDNSAQGIFTIGGLKQERYERNNNN
jgi:hypothetical protein